MEKLLAQKWFFDLFPNVYFIKINGKYRLYYKFSAQKMNFGKGQKIQKIIGSGIKIWIFCQNQECRSILNFLSKHIDRNIGTKNIWEYTCSSCGKKQYFIPDNMNRIPCTAEGVPLESSPL